MRKLAENRHSSSPTRSTLRHQAKHSCGIGGVVLVAFLAIGLAQTEAFSVIVALRAQVRTTVTHSKGQKQQQQQQGLSGCSPDRVLSSALLALPISAATNHETMESAERNVKPLIPSQSSRIERTLDPCVVLMKQLIGQYTDLWKDRGGIYSLAQGVVYWRPPASAMEAIRDAMNDVDNTLHLYSPDEGLPDLRQVLKEKCTIENGLNQHDIIVTSGANQAYMNCVLTLLDQHQKAVVFAPYYFNHVMALQMTLPTESLVVGPVTDQGIPDVQWLRNELRNDPSIHVVTITNPNNPTGVALERSYLQQFVDVCREYSCWLILDCTYEYFVHSPASHENESATQHETTGFDGCFDEPHVIHMFSLSKSYALAGYRCGYLALSQQATGLYDQMIKVQDTIPIAPSKIAQIAALGAIQGAGPGWVQEQFATLDTGRNAILHAVNTLETSVMGGSGAMYVMVQLPAQYGDGTTTDVEVCRTLVRDYGVAVIPGSFCGYPGWIRVCYANLPPEQCLRAAQRLETGLRSLLP